MFGKRQGFSGNTPGAAEAPRPQPSMPSTGSQGTPPAVRADVPKPVVDGTLELGYPASVIFGLGVVLLVSTVLYVIPRTAVLGAILLTGYLGGAVATHVRVGNPLFSHVLFPTYLGALIWGGLWLRDRRVRALLPIRGA